MKAGIGNELRQVPNKFGPRIDGLLYIYISAFARINYYSISDDVAGRSLRIAYQL
jgi:hypothetical protein